MPENGAPLDTLTRRMTLLRAGAGTPFDQLAVAVDYFRGAARRAGRAAPAPVDAVVLLVATQLWDRGAALLTTDDVTTLVPAAEQA